MKALSTVYPALGRFFQSESELANAACISRAQAWKCLNGIEGKDFTPQQKKALMADIIARMCIGQLDPADMSLAVQAYENRANFDELFKANMEATK
jgi:hypothetical protein